MAKTLLSKVLSYGVVEVVDTGLTSPRYSLHINGQIRQQSSDWGYIKGEYDKLY